MKSAMLTLICAALVASTSAFVTTPGARSLASPVLARRAARASPMMMARRSAKEMAAVQAENSYWEGEWICADCGYIYDSYLFGGLFFEEQTKGFKCPQCSGPRRRYAKKVGDTVGVTLDGGDGPILAASFLGIVITFALGAYFTFNKRAAALLMGGRTLEGGLSSNCMLRDGRDRHARAGWKPEALGATRRREMHPGSAPDAR
eukprot:CAMPEP_0182571444 /NCGR_PEP_ID=MMETSP1324-20130603/13359_1 /TAXON_ID=236786 /ORGANISM="Florenciella sp., Strain RCC1587" /LENGTH=203 /DNA_ID=CAMNT_0024786057 /DNA_START=55 /DNA_END=664 /DNA_ORIENTATION=-